MGKNEVEMSRLVLGGAGGCAGWHDSRYLSGGEGRRIPSAFPTTLSEHRQGKRSSGTVSESQNSEGCVTNVLLNFVRKNNPSFRLKEYFNLKCEYCHVLQIQS